MANYTKVFNKFLDLINWKVLQKSTVKLNTDYKRIKFFTRDHLNSMIYFHLTESKGLRNLADYLNLNEDLDVLKRISLATLSTANSTRDFNVFLPVLNDLICNALSNIKRNELSKKFGSVKLVDSSTVSMCLTYYKWATFRKTKAGIKLHTRFDLNQGIPDLFVVSNAHEHDKIKMKDLINDPNSIYIFDKGYVDYKIFDEYTQNNISFITRLKDNALVETTERLPITYCEDSLLRNSISILEDNKVYLGSEKGYNTKTKNIYRIIKVKDTSVDRELTFVTNIFNLTSEEIAWLYKKRWDIELFFKWIKQNLKISHLIGHTLNAVMIQIITGLITFIMLKLLQPNNSGSNGLLKIKRKLRICLHLIVDLDIFDWSKWLNSA